MPIKRLSQSSLLTFEKYSSVLAGNTAYIPPAFELLETQIVGATPLSSVIFSNLNSSYASTYQHLQIRLVLRGSLGSQIVSMQINGDTGNNYAYHGTAGEIEGNVRDVRSFNGSSLSSIFRVSAQGHTSTGVFGVGIVDILDAFETTKNKTIRSLAGQNIPADDSIAIFSGLYLSTSAINSITIFRAGSNFVTGSRLSLYGLRNS